MAPDWSHESDEIGIRLSIVIINYLSEKNVYFA